MAKDCNCEHDYKSSSSESSSEKSSEKSSERSSERSSNESCEPKCEQNCCIEKCKCYRPEEIACLYRDAVVDIQAEFLLVGASGPAGVTCGTPLGPNSRADIVLSGNGFFIRGHYIVCPAQLVLLPPALTSVANVYPFSPGDDLSFGTMKNKMTRASRILVSVFNVNGTDHSFVYEADLLGVDGAGDLALLFIHPKRQWNVCNPCIEKCHPFFNFGSSRGSKVGEKVYLIGDMINLRTVSLTNGIAEGLLANYRYMDPTGFALPEFVEVTAPVFTYRPGLPILNCQGLVIGMQTTSLLGSQPGVNIGPRVAVDISVGGLGGPSEFFMRRVIKELIKGTCSRKTNCHLELINQCSFGSFTRYKKGYLGVGYNLATGVNYDTTRDYTSGTAEAGFPRFRISPTGEFLNSPSCKELIGIIITGIAGANPNDLAGLPDSLFYVPGGTGASPLFPSMPVSPLLGKVHPGDIITHIECVALGNLARQIAPSLITWNLCAGDQVEICFRRGGNSANDDENCFTAGYDQLFTQCVCLQDYPPGLDYPWYSSIFPTLGFFPYEFVFPEAQSVSPQWPFLITGPSFVPSI